MENEWLRVSKILFALWCRLGLTVFVTWFVVMHASNSFIGYGNFEDFLCKVNEFIKNVYLPLGLSLTLIFLAAHLIFGR